MRKIITFFTLFILCTTFLSARQSLAFFRNGVQLENNAEITISDVVTEEFGSLVIESGLELKNISSQDVSATVTQTALIAPQAGTLSFCFDMCIPTNSDVEQTSSVSANSEHPVFHMMYYIEEGAYSSPKIKYEAWDTTTPDSKIAVTVTYAYQESTGLGDDVIGKNNLEVIQSGSTVKFAYSWANMGEYQVALYNITGRNVASFPLFDQEGVYQLPDNLSSGIYIVSVKQNNRDILTKKFVVK
ncbi:T9SS C-terminal target domain-containing protein [Paludibacter sp. 221]|uniref:T9SS type A sorting domain-containing protein n=1 Tax=Paludibacter sp. 221 TaxID=2302939 RepID=UPI0013D330FD|nr:T9SS type A sorting domain-containing protein [Paludibacter sp. 221]NDV47185.1 T9SS C-terminal target domain-containing protein [Paludibacter sp. 221]